MPGKRVVLHVRVPRLAIVWFPLLVDLDTCRGDVRAASKVDSCRLRMLLFFLKDGTVVIAIDPAEPGVMLFL
jgi:hypothetical protein